MNKYIVLLCGGICLVILIFGHLHWKKINESAAMEVKIAAEKNLKKEQEQREALINRLTPSKNKPQSLMDFLKYRALTQEKVVVTVLGSNGTVGTGASDSSKAWPALLEKNLRFYSPDLESLKINKRGYSGYSTSDLLKSKKTDVVINDNPDLVIFENSLIINHVKSISIKQTNEDLKNIMSILQKSLPNAKILIMSPNPISNSKNKNELGLTYLDYIKESEKEINKNKWAYLDTMEGMEKKLKDHNNLLVDMLASDYVNPNDYGNSLWFEVLFDHFKRRSQIRLAGNR
ncbi:SGNH/GDSL hydrolase family protein [Peribacillus glennii]|uniref:SGNH/GDSL hydrolase family protein n=1 Tax=Peribacillus glennii TaxID=2303991 RepID=A0A372LEL8_9BACI|nr:SGNH/GDSL hydrolase family protein [Peribacillus glennii]RFU64755.1 SGNH/GDSL hydrolase family protein [Peribacillus glennii]